MKYQHPVQIQLSGGRLSPARAAHGQRTEHKHDRGQYHASDVSARAREPCGAHAGSSPIPNLMLGVTIIILLLCAFLSTANI